MFEKRKIVLTNCLQVVQGGDVILEGELVVQGTLVVESGTRFYAKGEVSLEPTMQLEVVLLSLDIEEQQIVIIVCMSLSFSLLMSVLQEVAVCVYIFHVLKQHAANMGIKGTAPEIVRVRKEHNNECDPHITGHAEINEHQLLVVLSSEGCTSSQR
jgi:hypothetical protein